MIVWGGFNGGFRQDGALYDPTTDLWEATTSTGVGVPTGRNDHCAVWTGTRMIVWSGDDFAAGYTNTGAFYNPPGWHTQAVVAGSTPDDGSFVIPASVTTNLSIGTEYRVRITHIPSGASDDSDADLTIAVGPPPVAPYAPDANTVLLDHFDGSTSGTIDAFSYQGSNPEPAAAPNYGWVAGPNGLDQALELLPPVAEPVNSGTYVRYPGELLSTANGTIEFWLYATTWGLSLVDQGPHFGSGSGWTYGMGVDATGSLTASDWDFSGCWSLDSGAVKVPLDTWTHVAVSWGATGVKMYINGLEVGNHPSIVGPASGFGGNVLIRAGSSQSGGIIDELRISNLQRTVFNLP